MDGYEQAYIEFVALDAKVRLNIKSKDVYERYRYVMCIDY
jgi:hypothetical protein